MTKSTRRIFKKELGCRLTEAEVREKGQQLAGMIKEAAELQEEKKLTAQRFAADLKELGEKIKKCGEAVRHREEFRPVECEEVFLESGVVETVRLDTGERIGARRMTEEERQLMLFGDDPPWEGPGKPPESGDEAGEAADDPPPGGEGEADAGPDSAGVPSEDDEKAYFDAYMGMKLTDLRGVAEKLGVSSWMNKKELARALSKLAAPEGFYKKE